MTKKYRYIKRTHRNPEKIWIQGKLDQLGTFTEEDVHRYVIDAQAMWPDAWLVPELHFYWLVKEEFIEEVNGMVSGVEDILPARSKFEGFENPLHEMCLRFVNYTELLDHVQKLGNDKMQDVILNELNELESHMQEYFRG